MIRKITVEELKPRIDQGDEITILEALPLQYYRKGHIPGALNFPVDQVDQLAKTLLPNKEAEIVVYCANAPCENSEIVAERLAELGYRNVSDYVEGKEDWLKRGYPVVRGTAPQAAACCAS